MKIVFLLLVGLSALASSAQSVTQRDSLAKLLKTLPNDTNRVMVLNALGFQYRQSKPDMTYLLGQQAYQLAQTLNYQPGEARALATMAAAFKFLGDYAKSLKLYNQAKEINIRINDRDRVAVIINNTADLYIQQGEWQKGLTAMRACFAIYNTLNNPQASSKSVYLSNLAECFYHLNQLDSARHYLTQALKSAKTDKETILPAIYYLSGDVALAQHDTRQARFFYRQCIGDATQQGSYSDLYEGYYRLANLYGQTARRDSAIYCTKLALNHAQQANYLRGILQSSQQLATLYENQNDTEALRYYKLAVAAKDSLYSQDKVKRLLSITFEEKEKAQQQEAQKAAYDNRIRLTVLTGILGLFISIALILYRNNRQKQTANRLLQGKNAEIELLLKEIHHRVKNNLEVVSSLLELQSAQITDPDVQEAMLASQNRVQSMGILHQKLYQSEHLAFIEMKQYFMNLSETILDSYSATSRVTVDFPMPELELDVDTAVPVGLIVNELVTNALKYAFPNGQPGRVLLALEDLGAGRLRLRVADNGIGKPTNGNPQGTGFGTQLVDLLTRQLDGVLRQENTHGTSILIEFNKLRVT